MWQHGSQTIHQKSRHSVSIWAQDVPYALIFIDGPLFLSAKAPGPASLVLKSMDGKKKR